ncbi:helix-hairpin-helix domain-containing protein [Chloroflexota bacterium]
MNFYKRYRFFILLGMILILVWLRKKQEEPTTTGIKTGLVIPDVETEPLPARAPTFPDEKIELEQPEENTADDLTIISGVGPKMSKALNSFGISTFSQLAASDPNEIKQHLEDSGYRLGDPKSWIEQAQALS